MRFFRVISTQLQYAIERGRVRARSSCAHASLFMLRWTYSTYARDTRRTRTVGNERALLTLFTAHVDVILKLVGYFRPQNEHRIGTQTGRQTSAELHEIRAIR